MHQYELFRIPLLCSDKDMVSFIRPMSKDHFFRDLYSNFSSSITVLDCGEKCAPYNQGGIPFCCDTRHSVPTAYEGEWGFLQESTDLWHLWQVRNSHEHNRLVNQLPSGQTLIECKGYQYCQRDFRSIACRAFPFFPYFNSAGSFLGLSYYWEYEDRCWVISNLEAVKSHYRTEFIVTFEQLFNIFPEEINNFIHQSRRMRYYFQRQQRAIILLHRNGNNYKISPKNERLRKMADYQFPKHGNYLLSSLMPFPDER